MYRVTWETAQHGASQQDFQHQAMARDKATMLILMHQHQDTNDKLTISIEKQLGS